MVSLRRLLVCLSVFVAAASLDLAADSFCSACERLRPERPADYTSSKTFSAD